MGEILSLIITGLGGMGGGLNGLGGGPSGWSQLSTSLPHANGTLANLPSAASFLAERPWRQCKDASGANVTLFLPEEDAATVQERGVANPWLALNLEPICLVADPEACEFFWGRDSQGLPYSIWSIPLAEAMADSAVAINKTSKLQTRAESALERETRKAVNDLEKAAGVLHDPSLSQSERDAALRAILSIEPGLFEVTMGLDGKIGLTCAWS